MYDVYQNDYFPLKANLYLLNEKQFPQLSNEAIENFDKSFFDKRHTRIVITDKGKNLIQETEDIYQDIMNKMKMILSEEEIESCIHSIDQIKELFK